MENRLTVIERESQRVLTTAQLAESYRTDAKLILQNFSRNEDRYKVGKHYFKLEGNELEEFKKTSPQTEGQFKHAPTLLLWTEKGALLHAKSLNTDQAWDVYEKLVDDYFRIVTMLPGADKHKLPSNNKQILLLTGQVEQYKEFTEAYSDQIASGFSSHNPEYLTEKEACKVFKRSQGFFRSELVYDGYLKSELAVLRITEKGKEFGEEFFVSVRRKKPFSFRWRREVFEGIVKRWDDFAKPPGVVG